LILSGTPLLGRWRKFIVVVTPFQVVRVNLVVIDLDVNVNVVFAPTGFSRCWLRFWLISSGGGGQCCCCRRGYRFR
jgi:hypothetical protein